MNSEMNEDTTPVRIVLTFEPTPNADGTHERRWVLYTTGIYDPAGVQLAMSVVHQLVPLQEEAAQRWASTVLATCGVTVSDWAPAAAGVHTWWAVTA